MKHLPILVLIASAMFATSVSAGDLVKHDDGVTYDDIKTCLVDIGLEDKLHFRKGKDGMIQMNWTQVSGDSLSGFKSQIDDCWKKKTAEKKK